MEDNPIIISLLHESREILNCFWCWLRKQFNRNISKICGKEDFWIRHDGSQNLGFNINGIDLGEFFFFTFVSFTNLSVKFLTKNWKLSEAIAEIFQFQKQTENRFQNERTKEGLFVTF